DCGKAELHSGSFCATRRCPSRLAGKPMAPLNSAFADIVDLIVAVPEGDEAAVAAVRERNGLLTKPVGSLGVLEELVEFLARWQHRSKPRLGNPMVTIFAGTHGVVAQGVSANPPEVTAQ